MKHRWTWLEVYFCTCLALFAGAGACGAGTTDEHEGITLEIGSVAPSFQPFAWLKGEPVLEFQSGHVYIVEFWATWCGPCKAAMPHLSALARKYSGRVTVIGVNVRELQSPRARHAPEAYVRKFVEEQGDRMDYTVAMDDPVTQPIFNTWMKAAGLNGIPTAFVVDGTGRIAWFETGATMTGLEHAIEGALAGNVDYLRQVELQGTQAEERARERERLSRLLKPLHEAAARGDHTAVLCESDRLMDSEDVSEARVKWQRLTALLHTDESRGLDYARQVIGNRIPDPDFPQGMPADQLKAVVVHLIVREDGLGEQSYQFPLALGEELVAGESRSPTNLQQLAQLRFRIGDLNGAIAAQEQALALARSQYGTEERWQKWIGEAEGRLEEYRAKTE